MSKYSKNSQAKKKMHLQTNCLRISDQQPQFTTDHLSPDFQLPQLTAHIFKYIYLYVHIVTVELFLRLEIRNSSEDCVCGGTDEPNAGQYPRLLEAGTGLLLRFPLHQHEGGKI